MLEALVRRIGEDPACVLLPPRGQPRLRPGHQLPADVARFYALCGGAVLFQGRPHGWTVLPPERVVLANPLIAGVAEGTNPEDISWSWYTVAAEGDGSYLTLDLHPHRLGRCYDSFWDRHAVAGSCAVVARSFTELLERLLRARGETLFWLDPSIGPLQDAYDTPEA